MVITTSVSGLVLAAALAASPAQNADTLDYDVRCLYVAVRVSQLDDPSLQSAGFASTMYFMGRLDGRLSEDALEERLTNESLRVTEEEFKAAAIACGDTLIKKGEAMQRIGQGMMDRASRPPQS